MTQYRKKPITIEAVRFDGLNPTEIKDFVGKNCEVKIYDNEVTPPVACIVIHTLEGDMKVSKGDYIIKGVKGEFYPCRPDIFEQTYESAESQKGLDEAADMYAPDLPSYNIGTGYLPPQSREDLRIAFKDGAEWMAERGVSMEYEVEDKCLELGYGSLPGLDPIINLPDSFKPGDKVVVQIRKKD